jgi:hypothetical protein
MTVPDLLQFGPLDTAKRHLPDGTARMEWTARRRVNRARYFPLKQNASTLYPRIGNRHCGEQRLGVWVERVGVELSSRGDLDHASQVHDCYSVADMLDYRQVVCDENVSQIKFPAKKTNTTVPRAPFDRFLSGTSLRSSTESLNFSVVILQDKGRCQRRCIRVYRDYPSRSNCRLSLRPVRGIST